VSAYLREQQPKLIIVPHTGDAHPTHRAVLRTILEAILIVMHELPVCSRYVMRNHQS
jgi:LmbE family N-acetylglucosaminyl deacetylase